MSRSSERLGVIGQDPTRRRPQRPQLPMIEFSAPTGPPGHQRLAPPSPAQHRIQNLGLLHPASFNVRGTPSDETQAPVAPSESDIVPPVARPFRVTMPPAAVVKCDGEQLPCPGRTPGPLCHTCRLYFIEPVSPVTVSVTPIVNDFVWVAVGVPEMVPVLLSSVSPVGSVPPVNANV